LLGNISALFQDGLIIVSLRYCYAIWTAKAGQSKALPHKRCGYRSVLTHVKIREDEGGEQIEGGYKKHRAVSAAEVAAEILHGVFSFICLCQ
jgi:hypothetical protein